MKNLKTEILDFDGKSVGKTYGLVLSDVLSVMHQQDQAGNLYRYYTLAEKLRKETDFKFDKEIKEFILEKVGRIAAPLVYGRLKDFLDEQTKEPVKEENES